MATNYTTFLCPYPFIVPKSAANDQSLTIAKCTQALSTILDPEIAVYQVIFCLIWAVAFAIHFRAFNNLRGNQNHTPVEYYRYNMAQVGMVQAALILIYWIIHETRGLWSYNINNYIDEFAAFFLFLLALDLVEFWGAIAKIKVKLRVSRHGIPKWEKILFLLTMGTGLIMFGGLEYFGPRQHCGTFAGLKYVFAFMALSVMLIRSFLFVKSIDKDILAMEGTGSNDSRRKLSRQLRVKFSTFATVVIGFILYCLYKIYQRFSNPAYIPYLESNWNTKYEAPLAQILYVPTVYAILFQFANITLLPCRSDQRITDEGKDVIPEPKSSHHSTNPPPITAVNSVRLQASVSITDINDSSKS